jgi:ATP-dependent DNA ligase
VPEVVLDGELCAGNGMDGIQSVLEARGRLTGDTSLVVFDVLHLDGRDVRPETFRHRRTRLESLLAEPVPLRGRVDPGLGGASPPVAISGPSGVARGSS